MENTLNDRLDSIRTSFPFFAPELILIAGILVIVLVGLIAPKQKIVHTLAFITFTASLGCIALQWNTYTLPTPLFNGMLRSDSFSAYLKILFNVSGILTVLMSWRNKNAQRLAEYYTILLTIGLGANLLVMSMNFIILFIALELISISSYILTGFAFDKRSTEGSLKYFLFGAVASAVMLYGFSFLYGITGTLNFSAIAQINPASITPLFLMAGLMALTGFFYKIAAAPLHPWAPDVYEAAPMPIVAFFSVVPKLAGVGILTKFITALHQTGQNPYDWQIILCIVAILTLTVGNFSALWQKSPKRLMAYSSIAQSGFLLVGVVALLPHGISFMLFYASVYVLMNFLIFIYLQYFDSNGLVTIASFNGIGKLFLWPLIFMLIGFIALTGLPPTAGFTAKLFIFSSLWDAYQLSGKAPLLWLIIFGLLNAVISLFYYLRIPYYAFIKNAEPRNTTNNLTFENLLGLILVLLILILFFNPELLMGWINKINFVL